MIALLHQWQSWLRHSTGRAPSAIPKGRPYRPGAKQLPRKRPTPAQPQQRRDCTKLQGSQRFKQHRHSRILHDRHLRRSNMGLCVTPTVAAEGNWRQLCSIAVQIGGLGGSKKAHPLRHVAARREGARRRVLTEVRPHLQHIS